MVIPKIYKAAKYLRLSKEDGDFSFTSKKQESNSISSQRDLIDAFALTQPDIRVVAEYVDDGYTGTNFDRPSFQKMIEAVKCGEIDCIIVKDLSRFGREYIDAGTYIEKLFPKLGVRFISINDHYDSLLNADGGESLMVSFKNLINDSYSRDISIKVRTNLEAKRQRGEFIANYAPFGYRRDPEDKNHLLVDEPAAAVVRDIFRWKIEGLNPAHIAQRLNNTGVLPPMAYKRSQGIRYKTGFSAQPNSKWSSQAIYRILSNEVYCGNLVQGRRTTVNYKLHKVIQKDAEQWSHTESAHEAVIDPVQFRLVQRLMNEESRSGKGEQAVRSLAGRVFCGNCLTPAKRKVVSIKGKKYIYYSCPGSCASRSISEEKLENIVLVTLRSEVATIVAMDDMLRAIDASDWEKRELKKLNDHISRQESSIQRNKELKVSVYEDFKAGLVSQDDLAHIKKELSSRIDEARARLTHLQEQRDELAQGLSQHQGWLGQFRQYGNLTTLTRTVVVNLVDRILLFPDKSVKVELRHRDQLRQIAEYLSAKEAG